MLWRGRQRSEHVTDRRFDKTAGMSMDELLRHLETELAKHKRYEDEGLDDEVPLPRRDPRTIPHPAPRHRRYNDKKKAQPAVDFTEASKKSQKLKYVVKKK